MRYVGKIFRPPSEARSLIVQATIGCTHNECTFCSMYKDDTFTIRSSEEIKKDLMVARERLGYIRRIFIADGDALAMKQEQLIDILSFIGEHFPECERVGIYASAGSILGKSVEELKKLKELNLGMIYLGVESGSEQILKNIKKGVTRDEMIKACKRVKESTIPLSITLISGIGGRELTKEHSIESAKLISEVNPDYVGLLTLLIEEEMEIYDDIQSGRLELLEPEEILLETRLMVENIEAEGCVFRTNHVSNYVNLRGVLSEDKELVLAQLDEGLKRANYHEIEKFRRM